jgi:hypothetical protein
MKRWLLMLVPFVPTVAVSIAGAVALFWKLKIRSGDQPLQES